MRSRVICFLLLCCSLTKPARSLLIAAARGTSNGPDDAWMLASMDWQTGKTSGYWAMPADVLGVDVDPGKGPACFLRYASGRGSTIFTCYSEQSREFKDGCHINGDWLPTNTAFHDVGTNQLFTVDGSNSSWLSVVNLTTCVPKRVAYLASDDPSTPQIIDKLSGDSQGTVYGIANNAATLLFSLDVHTHEITITHKGPASELPPCAGALSFDPARQLWLGANTDDEKTYSMMSIDPRTGAITKFDAQESPFNVYALPSHVVLEGGMLHVSFMPRINEPSGLYSSPVMTFDASSGKLLATKLTWFPTNMWYVDGLAGARSSYNKMIVV